MMSKLNYTPARKAVWLLFWAAVAYLLFANLVEAIPAYPDENRAYHQQPYSPLIFVFSLWATKWTHRFDTPYYVNALFALANVMLVYRVTRTIFSAGTARWAMVFYAFYDYPLSFAKQLYYSTQNVTFLLLALWGFAAAEKHGRWGWAFLSGASLGILFLENPSSYAGLVAAGVFFLLVRCLRLLGSPCLSFTVLFGSLVLGFELSVLLVNTAMASAFPETNVLANLWKYQKETLEFQTGDALLNFLRGLWRDAATPATALFRQSFIVFSAGAALVFSWMRGDWKFPAFFLSFCCGALVFAAASCMGVHTMYTRHFVWMAVPAAAAVGLTAERFSGSGKIWVKGTFVAFFAATLALSGYRCAKITQSMLSFEPIFLYLREHGIEKKKVMSAMPLARYNDYLTGDIPRDVPVMDRKSPRYIQGRHSGLIVHWRHVFVGYQRGEIKYFLSSGIGDDLMTLGMRDPFLDHVQPLETWPHPVNNVYLFGEKLDFRIRLYALEDVFRRVDPSVFL